MRKEKWTSAHRDFKSTTKCYYVIACNIISNIEQRKPFTNHQPISVLRKMRQKHTWIESNIQTYFNTQLRQIQSTKHQVTRVSRYQKPRDNSRVRHGLVWTRKATIFFAFLYYPNNIPISCTSYALKSKIHKPTAMIVKPIGKDGPKLWHKHTMSPQYINSPGLIQWEHKTMKVFGDHLPLTPGTNLHDVPSKISANMRRIMFFCKPYTVE